MNAVLGLILTEEIPNDLRTQLVRIQKDLFVLGADLATPLSHTAKSVMRVEKQDTERLEEWGDAFEKALPMLQKFILPSGCKAAAMLHQARTICRRGERWLVDMGVEDPVNPEALVYINRLSDYFFLAARMANKADGTEESEWLPTE